MEALRSYIEGERAFRAGSYLPAIDAFRRAVIADPDLRETVVVRYGNSGEPLSDFRWPGGRCPIDARLVTLVN